jgi:hypothetical protein
VKGKTGRKGSPKAAPDIPSGAGITGSSGCATRQQIDEALTARPLDCALSILDSKAGAVRLAKIQLGEMTVKVLFAAMPVDAPDLALGD